MHLCDVIWLRVIRCSEFTSETSLFAKQYEFVGFILSLITRSLMFQLSILFILDHCKQILEDNKEFVFGPHRIDRYLHGRIINERDNI